MLSRTQHQPLQHHQQQQQHQCPTVASRAPALRSSRRVCTAKATSFGSAPESSKLVHDGRLPFWKTLEGLIRPRDYAEKVQNHHPFAWGNYPLFGIPAKDRLFIADLDPARSIMASEMQLGVGGDWPDTFQGMLGSASIAMTTELEMHARLRQQIIASFTKESIQQLLPQLQQTAAVHLERWAAATAVDVSNPGSSASAQRQLATTADGSMILGYPAVRLLTFDVLVNSVFGLQMSDQEIQQYEALFKDLIGGFLPPAWDVPFTSYGKGMKARKQIVARVIHTLSSPHCSGALARLRDEFGADSPEAVDNTINVMFAGFDTTSSTLTYMLYLLAKHPEVLEKVDAEQAAVVSKYGPTLTPTAYAAMPYTMAVIKETLRLAQIISNVPRLANKELAVPGGPTLRAGCPFLVNLEAISKSDPAIQQTGDWDDFKPERWLDPIAAKSLAQYQLPFGTGQHSCVGINLAYAEMAAVLAELSRNYTFVLDGRTEWRELPIKSPTNNLPMRLTPKAAAAGTA